VTALRFLDDELRALEAEGRRRFRPAPSASRAPLCLCSNDYLGYATTRAVHVPHAPLGAGASRLIAGNHPEHEALERAVSTWVDHEDALVFSSGYAANVGLLSALARPGDVVLSDALNHASIIDGCRMSRAEVVVFPHGDTAAAERALSSITPAGRLFVVTEGYFSMDGDVPELPRLRAACDRAGAALIVDEAHSLGVFGPRGSGSCAAAGVRADAVVGTFGKAVGGQGAFVAGPRALTDWLWNRARSFVFSTGLSPLVAAANTLGVELAIDDDDGRSRLAHLSSLLRASLSSLGYDVPPSSLGPIVPILVGDERRALALARSLDALGVQVTAIRPPTVPAGTCRLRATVHARMTDDELARAVAAFREARSSL
jgi:8-amino-7-oxononanoate synthase